MTSGQQDEAVDVLRLIRDHNGSAFAIELADVHDPVDRETGIKGLGQYESLEGEDAQRNDLSPNDLEASSSKMRSTEDIYSNLRESIQDYVDRLSHLLNPQLRRVTLLTWALWFTASAAYT